MDRETDEDRDERRTRLEREIREILERTDRPPSNVIKFQSRVRRDRHAAVNKMRSRTDRIRVTGLSLLIASVALAILASLVDESSPLIGRILAVASFAALVWLYVRYFRHPDEPAVKQWRGRDVDFSPTRRPDWFDRKFGGPKRPRR